MPTNHSSNTIFYQQKNSPIKRANQNREIGQVGSAISRENVTPNMISKNGTITNLRAPKKSSRRVMESLKNSMLPNSKSQRPKKSNR